MWVLIWKTNIHSQIGSYLRVSVSFSDFTLIVVPLGFQGLTMDVQSSAGSIPARARLRLVVHRSNCGTVQYRTGTVQYGTSTEPVHDPYCTVPYKKLYYPVPYDSACGKCVMRSWFSQSHFNFSDGPKSEKYVIVQYGYAKYEKMESVMWSLV